MVPHNEPADRVFAHTGHRCAARTPASGCPAVSASATGSEHLTACQVRWLSALVTEPSCHGLSRAGNGSARTYARMPVSLYAMADREASPELATRTSAAGIASLLGSALPLGEMALR
jgi:hypothetical protein